MLYGYFEEGKFEKDVVLLRVDGEGTEKWLFRAQEKRNMQVCNSNTSIANKQVCQIYRGYSNVFVKYVFYFTSEVDNIYVS